MGAKSFRRSFVPIWVSFVIVAVLVIIVSPVSAGGVTSTPGGTTISVAPGDVFLLRHELHFDDPDKGGYFTIAITWNCPSSDENFTVENVWVRWTTGPEGGENVENVLFYDQPTTLGGENAWQVVVRIPAEDKVWVDENFNVDIWLRAESEGVPHKLGLFENVLDYGLGIMVTEKDLKVESVDPVTVHVLRRGVDVSITPENQSGPPCTTLNYTVTVTNTGTENDNFVLTWSDNAGWGDNITLEDNRFDNVPPDNNRTTTLHVHIPENAENCTRDNVTVTATSQENAQVSDNASCIAHAVVTVEEFTQQLVAGWNLVSFPVASEDDTPDNIFENVTYDMFYYDREWGFLPSPPKEPVELGVGYWAKGSDNTMVTTTGVPVENFTIDFVKGWNLVGFPVISASTTPDNLFENVTYDMFYHDREWGFLSPPPKEPVELGVGYWVKVSDNKTVTVPV